MAVKIIDGKFVAQKILDEVAREVKKLSKQQKTLKLAIVLVGKNPSSLSYIGQKEKACEKTGIAHGTLYLSEKISEKKLIEKIERLNRDKKVNGILVQMPLPPHINPHKVIKAIDPYKDVDGFHAYNVGKMCISEKFENLVPCTPRGVIRLLEFYKIPVKGKYAVVVGRSNIAGKPLSLMLLNRGATVTTCHSLTKNLSAFTKKAEILCVAVGVPRLINGNMIQKGCCVIDVGFTRKNGKIFGDVDFDSVSRKAGWLSPVPGGVGPMTVACLMENVVRAAQKQLS